MNISRDLDLFKVAFTKRRPPILLNVSHSRFTNFNPAASQTNFITIYPRPESLLTFIISPQRLHQVPPQRYPLHQSHRRGSNVSGRRYYYTFTLPSLRFRGQKGNRIR